MFKKKVVEKKKVVHVAPKKKHVEVVDDTDWPSAKPELSTTVNCDCGQPAHPGSHQCWACSHRA